MEHKRFVGWLKLHRETIIWGSIISIIIVGVGLYITGTQISNQVVRRTSTIDPATIDLKLEALPAPLSGILVDPQDAKKPIIGVMIENSPDARPQAGLDSAEVVFEAIAEGGITRFVAFYQQTVPKKLGPVRSVRPAYNDWIMSFDAAIAHAGGSAQGLSEIQRYAIKDLNAFTNGQYFYRDSARYAPHNLYTSMSLLQKLMKAKGFSKSTFTSWKFQNADPAKTVTAKTININISSYLFKVKYTYSAENNNYLRSVGGKAHIDANTHDQISVDNIIVMRVPYHLSGNYYMYDLVGSGTAYLINNGTSQQVTWKRASRQSSFRFEKNSKKVTLNRGQTWITAVSPSATVTIGAK